jgi:peptidoglycan/LPS O-acetylase OafA/YrhL
MDAHPHEPKQTLAGIQLGRGMAALLVVAFHVNDYLIPDRLLDGAQGSVAFNMGYAGVDFFFVLSGFIIYYIHHADGSRPDRLGSFLWKRFTRIYPLFWAVFLALILLYFIFPDRGPENARDPFYILTGFFIWPTAQVPIVQVAWTLEFELLFYAMFALMILHARIGLLIFAAWMLLSAANLAIGFDSFPLSFLFSPRNLQFLMGIVVAWFLLKGRITHHMALFAIGLAAFLATGLGEAYGMHNWQLGGKVFGYGIGAALMVAGLTAPQLKLPRLALLLGDASYSIYLVHLPFLTLSLVAVKRIPGIMDVPPNVLVAGALVIAAAIGVAVHLWVEKPLIAWTRRISGPAKVAA